MDDGSRGAPGEPSAGGRSGRRALCGPDYSREARVRGAATASSCRSCLWRTPDVDARINSHRAPLIIRPAYSPSCAKDVAAPTAFAHLLFARRTAAAKSIPRSPARRTATRDLAQPLPGLVVVGGGCFGPLPTARGLAMTRWRGRPSLPAFGGWAGFVPQVLRVPISRRTSLSMSRFLMASRLSWDLRPRARPISNFTRPPLK